MHPTPKLLSNLSTKKQLYIFIKIQKQSFIRLSIPKNYDIILILKMLKKKKIENT